MKKILKFFLVFAMISFFNQRAMAQATWQGIISDSWFDAENWEWEGTGSGVPDAGTDVYLLSDYLNSIYPYPVVYASDTPARVNNIIGIGYADSAGALGFVGNGTLEVYGDIIDSMDVIWFYGAGRYSGTLGSGTLLFKGEGDQHIGSVILEMSNVKINKPSGNVVNDKASYFCVAESIVFENSVVPIGEEPIGNLILDSGKIYMWQNVSIQLPHYNQNQIPPHIVTKNNSTLHHAAREWMSGYPIYTVGNLYFPVGYSTFSYSPVTINSSDTNKANWSVNVQHGIAEECGDTIFSTDSAVNLTWKVLPTAVPHPDEVVPEGAYLPSSISFEYNKINYGHDVTADYEFGSPVALFVSNDSIDCQREEIPISVDNNYVLVQSNDRLQFGSFLIGKGSLVTVLSELKAMADVQVYPNPAFAELNIGLPAHQDNVQVTLCDISGKVLYEQKCDSKIAPVTAISLKSVSPGIYLLRGQVKRPQYKQKSSGPIILVH